MTNNPLERRPRTDGSSSRAFGAPCAGDDPQGWCDDRNANLRSDAVEWVVGSGGSLTLRTKQTALAKRMADERRRFDEEGRKALHRLKFPVADMANG